MKHSCAPSMTATRQHGFSLIEIIVGLAIGLISLLVMFQIFNTTGEQHRTTGSGNDAQIAGTLGMFNIERDVQQAGLGFANAPPRGEPGGTGGCTVHAYNSALATSDFTFKFVPVLIIRTANSPDEIRTLYGNSAFVSVNRKFTGATNSTKSLVYRDAFQLGDKAIFTDSATDDSGVCALAEISGYVSNLVVSHAQGETYTSFYTGANAIATMNAAGSANTQVAAAGVSGNFAYNLGPEPTLTSWRVSSAGAANPGKLLRRNILVSDTDTEVAEGVADLKAQYGVDANGDGAISSSEWQDADPTNWTQLLAVRFAVLARSQQFEKTEVTTTSPSWSAGAFTMRNVDGTTDAHDGSVNDWRHYRYRVYESVVPLRNMLWHP